MLKLSVLSTPGEQQAPGLPQPAGEESGQVSVGVASLYEEVCQIKGKAC